MKKGGAVKPQVLIVMGSDSDIPVMEGAEKILREFSIPYIRTIASAHRSPERAVRIAAEAEKKGVEVLIAGAGMAAHLGGILAAHTILPVIGVPIDAKPLKGLDALLSTAQMPPGVPVATMAIGSAGAKNAAILAAQIIARKDRSVAKRLKTFKKQMSREVDRKAAALESS
jgi:phosphoribosylaminoimidazole carboxylase PurE protein